ncbi:hypothetical protein EYF80_060543 [Liparis tanakae]|uniref:Uncharacterized protein n=1 Tax=Liparis tanakae TaxID=230148 RepID=A0A4Z2EL66_9TELE|nr:hypothetical protein EYF80_060543 [Liparis tanakae]
MSGTFSAVSKVTSCILPKGLPGALGKRWLRLEELPDLAGRVGLHQRGELAGRDASAEALATVTGIPEAVVRIEEEFNVT